MVILSILHGHLDIVDDGSHALYIKRSVVCGEKQYRRQGAYHLTSPSNGVSATPTTRQHLVFLSGEDTS
jgi:hypothetical protein